MSIKKTRKSNGFSVIELMVSFVLLSLLLTGMVMAGLYSLKNTQFARNKSIADKLAIEQLERFRVVRDTGGINAISSCNPCFVSTGLKLTPSPAPSGPFIQSIYVTPNPVECPSPAAGGASGVTYKAISKVTWDSTVNPTKGVQLETCFTNWSD